MNAIHPPSKPPAENKALAAVLLMAAIMGMAWLFMVQPVFDRQQELEDAVTGSRHARPAEERRHAETIGSILCIGAFAVGVGLWVSSSRATR